MNDSILDEILKSISEINKKELEKFNITYLPIQQTIEIMEKKGTHASESDAVTADVRSALSTFNKVQNAKRQQIFRRTKDYDDLTGKNEKPAVVFDPSANMTSEGDAEEYLKPWGKLDKQQKINRLMAYINSLKAEMSLTNEQLMQLRQLMICSINERQITRKSDVEYCEKTGTILRVPGLKLNPDTNKFYIGTDTSDVKLTKVTTEKLQPVKKLDLNNIKEMKETIVVKKKLTIVTKTS